MFILPDEIYFVRDAFAVFHDDYFFHRPLTVNRVLLHDHAVDYGVSFLDDFFTQFVLNVIVVFATRSAANPFQTVQQRRPTRRHDERVFVLRAVLLGYVDFAQSVATGTSVENRFGFARYRFRSPNVVRLLVDTVDRRVRSVLSVISIETSFSIFCAKKKN